VVAVKKTPTGGKEKASAPGSPWRFSRRSFLTVCATAAMGGAAAAAEELIPVTEEDDERFDHHWSIGIDVEKCIGCGRCVAACRAENDVPEELYRTWIERYVIMRDGQVHVDSPNGGEFGFPEQYDPAEVRRAFHVPKMCNHCIESACTQVCPVGATFESPDGVTLVDRSYCIGCAYCVQACPYGCRFINPERQVADKCTLCYHRISRGLLPACVEVCPTGARIFGDLNELDKDPDTEEVRYPEFVRFLASHDVQVLKPHLGTRPKVFYNGLDQVVS
jgi:Fe-S-cluster-containing dehydrogenase component